MGLTTNYMNLEEPELSHFCYCSDVCASVVLVLRPLCKRLLVLRPLCKRLLVLRRAFAKRLLVCNEIFKL